MERKRRGKIIIMNHLGILMVLLIILGVFTKCGSSQNLDKNKMITDLQEPYMQKWSAETKDGGSGYMLYFPVAKESNIILEHVYYRGRKVLLTKKEGTTIFVGRYKNFSKPNLVMHSDPLKEYGNKLPELPEKIPYQLQKGECVVEYILNGKKGHIRLNEIAEKES